MSYEQNKPAAFSSVLRFLIIKSLLIFFGLNFTHPSFAQSTVQVKVDLPLQKWQQRRASFIEDYKKALAGDKLAINNIDKLLTVMERSPFERTPLERLEIYGLFYLKREGFTKESFELVAQQVAWGLYDTLRYASKSGQAEIVDNERLFLSAYIIGGEQVKNDAIKFIQNSPDEAAQIIERALKTTENLNRFREPSDEAWPTAYGLERLLCHYRQKEAELSKESYKSCPIESDLPRLPKEEWPQAWERTKQMVRNYYRINTITKRQ